MFKKELYINCKKIFFDFDGVIVDSNNFKEKAITESIKQVCPKNLNVENSISFFNKNAGEGREKKLSKFFDKNTVDKILNVYAEKCFKFFYYQRTTFGCRDFINKLRINHPHLKLHILSGGNYNEETLMKFENYKGSGNCKSKEKGGGKYHTGDEKYYLLNSV